VEIPAQKGAELVAISFMFVEAVAGPAVDERLGRARAGHLQKRREAGGFAISCLLVPLRAEVA